MVDVAGQVPPDAKNLVRSVLNTRKKLTSGEIHFEKRTLKSANDPLDELVVVDYTILFKPEKVKIKHCNIYNNFRDDRIPCQCIVWSNGETIKVPMEDRFAVSYLVEQKRSLSEMTSFHPWLLGVSPQNLDMLKNQEFDMTVLLADGAQDIKVIPGQEGDVFLWLLTFTIVDGDFTKATKLWIAPEKDNSVVRCESTEKYPHGDYYESFSSKLKKFGNHWFPEEIRHSREHNGKVRRDEIVRVTSASFGQRIADEEFTLKGLKLPQGRIVNQDGVERYWDGEKLVDTFTGPGLGVVTSPSRTRWMFLLIVNFVVCACIAVRLYASYRKSSDLKG